MAGLASKLGPLVPGISSSVSGSANRILAVQVLGSKESRASIYSKTSGSLEERPKPWDYKRYGYNVFHTFIDYTTKRFTDNSRVITVEGPPGLEKSKFAKELADELGMKYVPNISMDDWYINAYGYDLRDLDYQFTFPILKAYDEKIFAQNPSDPHGRLDRMVHKLFIMRALAYNDMLAHLFNTGEGIVTEKSPYSDYVFQEACFKMGWIDKTSRIYLNRMRRQACDTKIMLRPNLIIYLDAPVDVVQAKIKARSETTHPWEKNSPVYQNTAFMTHMYENLLKGEYLKKAAPYSRVLTYDWSEGGDTEVVVEDIERLNMDYFDIYDKQQSDWRMQVEEMYCLYRIMFTQKREITSALHNIEYMEADKIMPTAEEAQQFLTVAHKLPGNGQALGYNEDMGDSTPLLEFKPSRFAEQPTKYFLCSDFVDNVEFQAYWKERERRKAAGDPNYWNF